MKKVIMIGLVVSLVLVFSVQSQAQFRLGFNKIIQQQVKDRDYARGERMAITGEYVLDNNYSVYFRPRLSEDPLLLEVGSRYYSEQDKGLFADLSFNSRTENEIRDYIDFTIGGGYLLELNDYFLLDLKTGYTITASEQDNYASLSLGIKFGVSDFVNQIKNQKQSKEILRNKYPGWDEEIIAVIDRERIVKNMNTTQVIESWGQPNNIETNATGDYQKWVYEFGTAGEETYKSYKLYFVERRLSDWLVNE